MCENSMVISEKLCYVVDEMHSNAVASSFTIKSQRIFRKIILTLMMIEHSRKLESNFGSVMAPFISYDTIDRVLFQGH